VNHIAGILCLGAALWVWNPQLDFMEYRDALKSKGGTGGMTIFRLKLGCLWVQVPEEKCGKRGVEVARTVVIADLIECR
jgi:hypothetical protein